MADDELFHFGIAGYLGGLHGGGVEGFLGSGGFALGKGAFMEEQIHSLDLRNDAFQADGIRAVGITSGWIRGDSKPMVRHDGAVRCNIILSVLDPVQFEYGYLVKAHHVADDMVGRLLFLKKEAAGRYAVTQGDGADGDRTVLVDHFGFVGVDGMELYRIRHALAEEVQMGLQQLFQFLVGLDV